MELLDYAEKYNLEIDKDYYMGTYKSGQIISQLAAVCLYKEEFQIEFSTESAIGAENISANISENNTDEEIRKSTDKIMDKAKRHLTDFTKNP